MTEIPELNKLDPTPESQLPEQDQSSNGNNAGTDIYKFIKSQLAHPHFRELCRSYTDTMSERSVGYWIIFALCGLFDLIYYLVISILMLTTLAILVYGFAKAIGFTDLFNLNSKPNIQVQCTTQENRVELQDDLISCKVNLYRANQDLKLYKEDSKQSTSSSSINN